MRMDREMEQQRPPQMPTQCPACNGDLAVTRLQCPTCGTEVAGAFPLSGLATLREPYASTLALFLRVRGNMKDMERALGISYPTVRARLDEALQAAGLERTVPSAPAEAEVAGRRAAILGELERGEITAAEASSRLRALTTGRPG